MNGNERVSNKFIQGIQDLVKIITEDGEFKCTAEHKMGVMKIDKTYYMKKAIDMTYEDYMIKITDYNEKSQKISYKLVKVIEVVEDFSEQTFDIEVENRHEFFCNGYLSSNSAEIALGSVKDDDFINLKNFEINPERGDIAWMSNNSLVLTSDDDFSDFNCIPEMARRIRDNGEPGMINLHNIQKYGRLGKEYEDKANLVNPCGEIPLENMETCNLAEVFPPRCESSVEYYEALTYATFYASTVSLLPTHRPETNSIIARNRRIGVSISGIAQWASGAVNSKWGEMNYTKMGEYLRKGYKKIREINTKLAKQSGVPESIRVSAIKPSGSISLLAGCTPGVHYPFSRYAIRRVRIGETSPLVDVLKKAGVPHEKDMFSDNTWVFEFVIDHGNVRSADEVSPWEQFSIVQMLQKHYSDNCVSACLTRNHYVHTQDGFVTIDKICNNSKEEGFHPHQLNIINSNGYTEKSEQYYVNGQQYTIKVELESGRIIQGTYKHRIQVLDEDNEIIWKRLECLTNKDWVVSRTGLDHWGNDNMANNILQDWFSFGYISSRRSNSMNIPVKVSPKLGFWLGVLVNNGVIFDNKIRLNNVNNKIISKWEELTKELFGFEPVIIDGYKNNFKVYDVNYYTEMNKWLKYIGLYDEHFNKKIPDVIMVSNKLVVRQFIKGLMNNVVFNEENINIMFSSNKSVLRQLDVLLNNFGVLGFISSVKQHKRHRKENEYLCKEYYSFSLNFYNGYLYHKIIGFDNSNEYDFWEKYNTCKNVEEEHNIPSSNYLILIKNYLETYLDKMSEINFQNKKINRKTLEDFKNLSPTFYIPNHLLDKTYSFMKIKSIEDITELEETFDISVQKTNSYLANGIVSHNTITFDKEKDGPEIEKMLAMYIPTLKSVSMLPHSGHNYAQAPYQGITKEEYEKRLSNFTYPSYSSVKDNVPVGSKYCSGDQCEL